jgi:pimeloyl-ACP methyl ester carboxylesterase
MFKFLKSMITALALLVLVGVPQNTASANNGVGVLLMHGKGGTGVPLRELENSLKSLGFIVLVPDMPWHELRIWDKSFDESMMEIDGYVGKLKSKGAKKIVVGGQSLGANAALGYGARRKGVTGILAIAPGHVPELRGFQRKMENDWKRALKLVQEGRGNETFDFKDQNMGGVTEVSAKAKDYLSWYNPHGSAVMPHNAKMLNPGTALMWIIGKQDRRNFRRGKSYVFILAPSHPKNIYVEVGGGHTDTARIGENEIIKWLKGL